MKKYLRFIKELYDPEISEYLIEDGLTLDIVFNDIYSECGEYLNDLKKQLKHQKYKKLESSKYHMLYRGMMFIDDDFGVMYPIENRKTIDTPKFISEKFNELLYDKFGWYPRTEGVFAFQKLGSSSNYGESYMIFPVDGFEYIWSPNISDFYIEFKRKNNLMIKYFKDYDNLNKDNLINYFDEKLVYDYDNMPNVVGEENVITKEKWLEIMTEENIENILKNISDEYIDKDFNIYLKMNDAREIMIKCDKYYYVYKDYFNDFINFLENKQNK